VSALATAVRRHSLSIALALLGGVFGVLGALFQEVRSGGLLLMPFLGAPIIEESLKPIGIYVLVVRWPHVLRGQLHTALLAALSGLAFGVVESTLFVTLSVPNPPEWFLAYRFTAPVLMHSVASLIVGLGINRGLVDWAAGRGSFPRRSRNAYIAAMVLHALFNVTAVSLTLAGVLDVD
jgi:RsiW-degrading membrane proteinase PrsW (M82 family)